MKIFKKDTSLIFKFFLWSEILTSAVEAINNLVYNIYLQMFQYLV